MRNTFPGLSKTWLRLISMAAVAAILVQLAGPAIASANGGANSNSRGGENLSSNIGQFLEELSDYLQGLFPGSAGSSGSSGNSENSGNGNDLGLVVRDKFRDSEGTSLTDHEPDTDEVGGGWIEDLFSDFRITESRGGGAMEITDLGPVRIATVETLLTEYELSVEITRDVQANDTGVVVRYVDANNYVAVIYDGFWLKLVRVVNGNEELLKRRPVPLWLNGLTATLRVIVEADEITVLLSGWERFSESDSTFAGATRAGLYYKSNVESRFQEIRVDALSAAPGAAPVPAPNAPALIDTFDSADGTSLDAHTPDLAPLTGWQELVGDWGITGGAATLDIPFADVDQFAIIPTGVADKTISVDITYNDGFAGIVWDRDDAANFRFVFFDGNQLVLARVQSGNFIEHGRKALAWQPGQTRNVTVRVNGTSVRIYLDGSDIIMQRGVGLTQGSSGNAGLFARFSAANRFDNFVVRPSLALEQPDPTIPSDVPYVPEPISIPSDAWLYDSFNAYNLSWLQFRALDLDPSGDGWSVDSGNWYTWNGAASENSRVYDPLVADRRAMIDTGRDQYEMTVDVTWNGDRVGVLFGGQATGPEDLGQNQYGVWKSGDGDIYLYRWVGGVPYTVGGQWVEPEGFRWFEGQTKKITVKVEGTRARIYIAGQKVFDFVDPGLKYGTWVGLFQRGLHDERYDNFQISLLPGQEPPDTLPAISSISDQSVVETEVLDIPVVATDVDNDPITLSLSVGAPSFVSLVDNGDGTGEITIEPQVGDAGSYLVEVIATTAGGSVSTAFNVLVSAAPSGAQIVFDSFTNDDGANVPPHAPDVAPTGAVWAEASFWGSWAISGNRVTETSLIDWADHRVVIDSGESDGTVAVDIEYHGGSTGLTFRYIDENQLLLAWFHHTPSGEQVVLGYIVPGNFIEVDRVNISDAGLTWGVGETRNFSVVLDGDSVEVKIDGVTVISEDIPLYQSATKSGLFARAGVDNFFDNFEVTAP